MEHQKKAIKVLIIDDEQDIVNLLEDFFEQYNPNIEIHSAHNGLEGLKKIKEIQPDLITLDQNMPKMNGYQVCQELKKIQLNKKPIIVMITAHPNEIDEKTKIETGVNVAFLKPFNLKLFRIIIDELIVGLQ